MKKIVSVRLGGDVHHYVLTGQKKREETTLVRPVKTATVRSQSVILKDFSGMVEAVEYVKLAFRVSGQIINLPVVEGQRVRKGQLIAAIDPPGYLPAICRRQGCL